jgi:hypothetical protein
MLRRNIGDAVRQALADTPVVLLNGARQTGKTTLAQALAERNGAQYFTLDDAATFALAAGDPAGFIRNLSGPVVLDEIQKAPDLFPAIKLGGSELLIVRVDGGSLPSSAGATFRASASFSSWIRIFFSLGSLFLWTITLSIYT